MKGWTKTKDWKGRDGKNARHQMASKGMKVPPFDSNIHKNIKVKKPDSKAMYDKVVFQGKRGADDTGFWTEDELLAKTYGNVSKKRIVMLNPKTIPLDEWQSKFGSWSYLDDESKQRIIKGFVDDGYDGVISHFGMVGNQSKVIYKIE